MRDMLMAADRTAPTVTLPRTRGREKEGAAQPPCITRFFKAR